MSKYVQTSSNMSKYVQQSQNISKYVQISPNMLKYVEICPNMLSYVQMCPNIFNYVEIFQNTSKHQNSRTKLCPSTVKTRGQKCVRPLESRVVDKLADNNVSVHSGRVAAGVANFIFSKAGLEVNGHCGVKGVFMVSGRLGVPALRLVAPTPTSQEAPS